MREEVASGSRMLIGNEKLQKTKQTWFYSEEHITRPAELRQSGGFSQPGLAH
jgi:hypothetical protein